MRAIIFPTRNTPTDYPITNSQLCKAVHKMNIIYIHTHLSVCMKHTHIQNKQVLLTYLGIYMYTRICIYIYMHIHIYLCIYIYAYTYIFVHIVTYKYTHIYLYVHNTYIFMHVIAIKKIEAQTMKESKEQYMIRV